MVFRGRPSKACERCRSRRLKCDLCSGSCGQCVRANVPCSGYRDTQQLRVQDESKSIVRRALKNTVPPKPQPFPLSLDSQARGTFFSHYLTGTAKCWDFLKPYYHPKDAPIHLALAIDAVSLAYLRHQVYSDAALVLARERYVSALYMLNVALKSPEEAVKDTTLLTSLLLDLFEKMTNGEPQNSNTWTGHIKGALTLVRHRGLDRYRNPTELRVLGRLSNHYTISCIASGLPVPHELSETLAYVAKNLVAQDHTLRLADLLVRYAKLRDETRKTILSDDEHIRACTELDVKIQALELEMPQSWQCSTTFLSQKSDGVFGLHFDIYRHRNICQARNMIRVVRLLLNESLIEKFSRFSGSDYYDEKTNAARENAETCVREICASVPQYSLCCAGKENTHLHTPPQQADCYTLIFPLFAAGSSKVVPDVRPWVLEQLHHVASHFDIRNAEIVARMLERDAQNMNHWEVYGLLGSYAFSA